ncbi:MAG: hypothetical protein QM770_04425 [Tepidisphaeraceae bacterium]
MTFPAIASAIPAFPGAEGAGANASGGRGGDVYFVTSLADTNTAGTLRNAISTAPATGRTILFKTSGTIYLGSGLDFNKPNLTIAGQSAPGDGITLAYRMTRIVNTSNVVLRNIRMRPSNYVTLNVDNTYDPDGLWITSSNNVMVDHVSASWSVDETLSATNATTTTVQWSAITESLRDAGHVKGPHGYGSLVNGGSMTYHHNFYAHHDSRNPRPGSYNGQTFDFDFRNNVLYDWGNQAGYNGDEAGVVNMNYVGNYLVAGPSTSSSKTTRAFLVGTTETHIYQSGNKIDPDKDTVRDGTDTGWAMFPDTGTPPIHEAAPIGNTTYVTTQTADAAYASVVANTGATWWKRDAVDTRVFGDVVNMTGRIINSANDVGGYPTLNATTPPTDTDLDGLPDAWETSLGLNPNVKNNNADFDNDGYTDLEEYLNELAAWPAPAPAVFSVGSGRYALSTNWNTKWQPSRFDTVQIAGATAIVDAVGQDAGTILIGEATPLTVVAELQVTSGSLRVANSITIGSASAGQLSVTGGKLRVGGTIGVGSMPSAVFSFTGGTLAAGQVNASKMRSAVAQSSVGTFRQMGASTVLAPGDVGVAGRTAITGAYALDAGTVAIELGGATPATAFQSSSPTFDNVTATTAISLNGGTLALSLLNGYSPAKLASHAVMTGASRTGTFASVTGHQIADNKWLAVTYTGTSVLVTAATPGDLDLSGTVNFADLLSLAANYSATAGKGWAEGDVTGDGAVNFSDLLVLASFYGSSASVSFAIEWAMAQSLVPEPATLFCATIALPALRRRRRTTTPSPGTPGEGGGEGRPTSVRKAQPSP